LIRENYLGFVLVIGIVGLYCSCVQLRFYARQYSVAIKKIDSFVSLQEDQMKTIVMAIAAFFLTTLAARADCTATETEIAFWNSVQNTADPDVLVTYLTTYPTGCFVSLARKKLGDILPETPLLQITGQPSSGAAQQLVGNGETIDAGITAIESLKFAAVDPSVQIGIDQQCDAAGFGNSAWLPNGTTCPVGPSGFIQGFQARLSGKSAKYYSLSYECSTSKYKSGHDQDFPPTTGWCGVHAGVANTWISKVRITVTRLDKYNQ
jgi:hypothetical protein